MPRIDASAKRETHRRLLEAAASHFARRGLERANLDEVVRAAGVAKGTLYNYFSSKEELFFAVIEEGARRAAERYAQVQDQGTTRDRLLALAEADVSVLREEEQFMRVVVREAMSFQPATYPRIVEHLSPYLTRVERVIADGVENEELRSDVPTVQLALLFVGTLTMLYVQHWGSDGAWPSLDEVPALAVTTFVDGARRRTA
ncbi:MAG: TetR/AcrR family transcriptional regulator [Polyangiaceae bacterium]